MSVAKPMKQGPNLHVNTNETCKLIVQRVSLCWWWRSFRNVGTWQLDCMASRSTRHL